MTLKSRPTSQKFLSTLSLRRATNSVDVNGVQGYHFYPRSPCGERLFFVGDVLCTNPISIHALLAESDSLVIKNRTAFSVFLSTLSLRRATPAARQNVNPGLFLSTLSLRRATCYSLRHSAQSWYFYPRSPCGERLIDTSKDVIKTANFYPRSPCGERPL